MTIKELEKKLKELEKKIDDMRMRDVIFPMVGDWTKPRLDPECLHNGCNHKKKER